MAQPQDFTRIADTHTSPEISRIVSKVLYKQESEHGFLIAY